MSTASRQNKGPRKGPAEAVPQRTAASRAPAWGSGARQSPTFQSPNAPRGGQQPAQQGQQGGGQSFPPLAAQGAAGQQPPQAQQQQNGAPPRDRVLQALSGLTGTTVTLTTKAGQRLEGVVGSVSGAASTPSNEGEGLTLKDVKDLTTAGAPLREILFIAAGNIESYTSGPADARPPVHTDSFRTDTDISGRKTIPRERDLQAWIPSGDASTTRALGLDEETFGPLSSTGASANGTGTGANAGANGGTGNWDQFSANEQLFGVKASFDEDVYTTKLDRSAPDFKERERRAAKIANEIIGSATNNPHIAEERGVVDDSGANEEDKYGAVVRGQNAYVPPGARRPSFPPTASSPGPAGNAPAPIVATATNVATTTPTPANGDKEKEMTIPKVAVNGPDGATVSAQAASPASSKAASPAPNGQGNKPPADPIPAFRDFVKDEKQRLSQKRQALVKSDMDKRMADLVKFSQSFKLNKPIPEDLVPILAKDEERQRQITEKAKLDAASAQARAIGPSTPAVASRGVAVKGAVVQTKGGAGGGAAGPPRPSAPAGPGAPGSGKPPSQALAGKGGAGVAAANAAAAATSGPAKPMPSSTAAAPAAKPATTAATGPGGTKKINMVIQSIPPFRGGAAAKAVAAAPVAKSTPAAAGNGNGAPSAGPARQGSNGAGPAPLNLNTNTNANANRSPQATPMSPNTLAAKQLNAHASSFRPNPKANAFSPVAPLPTKNNFHGNNNSNNSNNGLAAPQVASGAATPSGPPASAHASHSASPNPKSGDSQTPATPNPFFGTRVIKKSTPVHVKDDFNPFKHNKVVDASQVTALWPYSGKRYAQMFPAQHPPPQHGAQMMPPMPPPIPPPSYEEDSAAQAAQQQQHRGYVYAYPQYAYPPQHMMPGMGPPGPPGPYMQGPYMQMQYPPGMPPPNAMYSPGMGQMPPPGAYMQPPPGAYPPPPNGGGPRPSMPPTPIPAHAHPYYHQSPQLQHAYPMMMAPPNIPPPHGYEGGPAPPVPMGGHA